MAVHQYYDENGKYHFHDSNTTSTGLNCSNKHKWSEAKRRNKCWCEEQESMKGEE